MDWLIYHLTGEVLTHYWYGVQCKAFGYIWNRKHEGIVVLAIIRASTSIPDTNVLICLEDNVAYVGSVNNRPKVWTVHSPDSEWAQCDCPIASQGMICKHAVKVFKMLHPGIEDGLIVREAGTLYGVARVVPMSQIWIKRHTEFVGKSSDNVIDLEDCLYDFGSIENRLGIDVEDPEDMFSQISIHEPHSGHIGQPTILFYDQSDSTPIQIHKNIRLLYKSLANTTIAYTELHDYLVADLEHIKGKQKDFIARGVANSAKHEGLSPFPEILGD